MNEKEKEAIKDLEEIANGALPPELSKKEAQTLVDLIERLQTKVYKLEYYESANDALIQNIKELKEEIERLKNNQVYLLNEGIYMVKRKENEERICVSLENLEEMDVFLKRYVPKDKIKEKIEKLKVLAETSDDEMLTYCELDIRKNQIGLLQNLLEECEEQNEQRRIKN